MLTNWTPTSPLPPIALLQTYAASLCHFIFVVFAFVFDTCFCFRSTEGAADNGDVRMVGMVGMGNMGNMGTYSFCHVCWLWKLLKRFLTVFVTLFRTERPWHVYFMFCCRWSTADRTGTAEQGAKPGRTGHMAGWHGWGDLNAPMTCSSGKHPTCPPVISTFIMQFSGHSKPTRNENYE